jgi:small conductance mechanosensitive channel
MEDQVAAQLQQVGSLADAILAFAVKYGLQILGALFILFLMLQFGGFAAKRVQRIAERRGVDFTLARFFGAVVKIAILIVAIVVALGNLGIELAPIIAFLGAGALGAAVAMQGVLSNYIAELAIILSRPFVLGNTIAVQGYSGVVKDIGFAATVLEGEDGERITIPNRDIVGQVIVNSDEQRLVETRIAVASDSDAARATATLKAMLARFPEVAARPSPQIGVHGFTYGGIILGLRFWVPSRRYYQTRYGVNEAALAALREAGIRPMPASAISVAGERLDMDTGSTPLSRG